MQQLDDLMGVDGKKQTAANFYKRDIQELAEDEKKLHSILK